MRPHMSAFKVHQNLKDDSNERTAFFDRGFLVNVSPRTDSISLYDNRDVAYNATVIYSDGNWYSLLDAESIRKIPIPDFSDSQDTVFSLDYILRMCASNLRNNGAHEISIRLLQKAVEIMPYSNIDWKEDDYLRLALWLYEDGRIKEGLDTEKHIKTDAKLRSKSDIVEIAKNRMNEIRRDSDLVAYSSYSGICCAECAKRSGRVYSFSGRDKFFPKLPADVLACGGFHPGCAAGLSPYYPGTPIYYMGDLIDAVDGTRRDYTDDRTPDDIQRYEQGQKAISRKNAEYANRKEYLILRALFPDGIPKSQYKFACKKADEPVWYSGVRAQAEREISILLDAEGHNRYDDGY